GELYHRQKGNDQAQQQQDGGDPQQDAAEPRILLASAVPGQRRRRQQLLDDGAHAYPPWSGFCTTASEMRPKPASAQVAITFFRIRYGVPRSLMMVISPRSPSSSPAACWLVSASRRAAMMRASSPSSGSIAAMGWPSIWISLLVTRTVGVSCGEVSAMDSGRSTALGREISCTSLECTSRKNTRMVKMSISATRLNGGSRRPRPCRLSLRCARRNCNMLKNQIG